MTRSRGHHLFAGTQLRPTPPGLGKAGRVLLLLTALFLVGPPSPEAHLALIRQHPIESVDFSEDDDAMGFAVAAGDFDGDGYQDLASGVPGDDREGLADGDEHGIVVVNRGSPFGLTHDDAYRLDLDLGSLPLPDGSIRFGHSLAVGYFNNDNYADLAVGAPLQDFPGSTSGGAVYVHYGSASGLPETPDLTLTQEDAGETSEIDEWFGWSLAVGDFDNNGRDDLAVGVPGEDGSQGMVCFFYSNAGGLQAVGSGFFKQGDLGLIVNNGDQFGFSLAAGNLIETTVDDLAVGEPYDRSSGVTRTGRVTVIPGSSPGGLTTVNSQNFNATDLGLLTPESDLSLFGFSLAVGRFNHTAGGLDLAIGEPGYPQNALPNSGRVIVQQLVGFGSLPVILTQISVPNTNQAIEANDVFGWSLAASDEDSAAFLAVGAPGDAGFDGGPVPDVGVVTLFQDEPGPMYPGSTSTDLTADWLFDRDRTLRMGHSLVFGDFDGADTLSLAIGAPRADYETWVVSSFVPAVESGQVHIYAPHRQVFQLRARSATASDCLGNLIFSLRLGDPLQIASTTKAMTAWIAADHLVWDLVDSTDTYTVPEYVADCVSGSQVGLIDGQTYRFWELFQLMVSESGNDASYSIGDLLTGETWSWPDGCDGKLGEQISAFADSMNQRALDIAMPYTFFNNPAGRPFPKFGLMPYSTALGMDFLGREAMKNPVYRQVVATTDWAVASPTDSTLDGSYGWLKGLQSSYNSPNSEIIGIKPGRNDPSLSTRLVAAGADTLPGDVIATIFGVNGGGWADDRVLQLAALAAAACPEFGPVAVDPDSLPQPIIKAEKIPSSSSAPKKFKVIGTLGVNDGGGGDVGNEILVELRRQDRVLPQAACSLSINLTADYRLQAGETAEIMVTPFGATDGIKVSNLDSMQVELLITHNQPLGSSFSVTIPAWRDSVVLGPSAVPAMSFQMTIENSSRAQEAVFEVEHLNYHHAVTLGDGVTFPDDFQSSIQMLQTPPAAYGNIVGLLRGLDGGGPAAGSLPIAIGASQNTVALVVREPGVQTAVPGDEGDGLPPGDGARRIGLLAAYPNPARSSKARVVYVLNQPSAVSLEVFDVAGRLVRVLERDALRPAGRFAVGWNTRDDRDREVASGVFFYRLRAAGEARMGRILVLR